MYIEKENGDCPQMNTDRHRWMSASGRGRGTAIIHTLLI